MTRRLLRGSGLVLAAAVLGSCQHDLPTSAGLPVVMVVSDTVGLSLLTSAAATGAVSGPAVRSAAYIALPPGSVPDGQSAVITNERVGIQLFRPMANGGLDPVAIDARPDDLVDVAVSLTGGVTLHFVGRVPINRPPTVVRTVPTRRKTAVPLNTRIEVVFSEPMDSASVVNGVQLKLGEVVVAGHAVVDSSGITVSFTPDSALDGERTYTIAVNNVFDRDGEFLPEFTSTFETGVASATPEPGVEIFALPVYVGMYTQFHGGLKTDIPGATLLWSSSDPTVVSIIGLAGFEVTVLGRRVGTATITAWSFGVVPKTIEVSVTAVAPDSLVISGFNDGYVGDTLTVSLAARWSDASGPRGRNISASWDVSDTTRARLLGPGLWPWTMMVEARDTGTVTITGSALGMSESTTLQFTRPTTAMRVLDADFNPHDINDSGQIIGVVSTLVPNASCCSFDLSGVLFENGALTQLGVLPGYDWCQPKDISNRGDIVGHCYRSNPQQSRAFIWKAGTMTDLGALPGDAHSWATSINDRGDIVGSSAGLGRTRPVLWQGDTIQELPSLPGQNSTGALGINASGQIVGWADTNGKWTAVVWREGAVESLGLEGMALGIDDAGTIVVIDSYYERSWIWRSDGVTDVGASLWGITANGMAFGSSGDGGSPVVWQAGTLRNPGTVPKHAYGAVFGANNRGQAVGHVNGKGVLWDLTQSAAAKQP